MANNKKFVTKNGLRTQNVQMASASEAHVMDWALSDSDVLTLTGTAGTLLTVNDTVAGNTLVVNGNILATSISATLTGNASTATALATPRSINGTNFDGTANITTANWGTGRTITIGSTGKSVNGSANVTWSLAEIGAAATSHTHAISDVTGLQTALDGKISSTEKGAANGVAPLGADSKIPATYLPSYVDEVLEYANLAAFPGTGATGIIYVALDTNRVYRWSGSAYVEISPSPGSTDAVPEGATNLYFTDARARAAVVQDTISDAVTDRAPSQNAVFDALAGKAATSHVHSAADITSGTLAVARGGTGLASYTAGNYIYASGATTLAQRTPAQVLSDIGAASASHNHTLDSLSNVTITSNTNGEILRWNGSAWVNNTLAEAGIAAASHTHAISDVTGLQTALDGKISSTEKGAANGVAPLGADSKIASTYLPSYVDDVLEYANLAAFPGTGATGIIYVALDTNKVYRWSGSAYVEISPSPGSTDAVPEGATNLYFTDARARAAVVQDTISDGVTDRAPSQNAVFDALAGKANTNHTHAIADVTGLQAALDGKSVYSPNATASTLHNNITLPSGFYTTSGGLYGPDGTTLYASSWHHVLNLRHADGNGYATQIATAFGHNGGGNGLYFRSANGTAWSQWRKIWHEGNDGSGSGLDADLLDGKHASEFAAASHSHTIADVSGLQGALDGKAAASHTHSAADITSGTLSDARLPSTMGGKTFLSPIAAPGVSIGDQLGYIYQTTAAGGLGVRVGTVGNEKWFGFDPDGRFVAASGGASFSGDVVATDFVRPSDERLKTNVVPLNANAKLAPVRFTWIEDGTPDIGFLAGQIEEAYPEAVKLFEKDGVVYKAVAYDKLTAVLAARLNYAMTQIEELRKEIDEIKKANG